MRIGVDLGGTKIEACALDAGGAMLWRRRVPTPSGDYAATLQAITELVLRLERELGRRGSVGIGIPGSPSLVDKRIRNANSTCLNGQPLERDLEALLQRPVRIANDANCFALSEARDGAGAGANSLFGVILGTGTGGGLVVNGQLITGANAIAGEWGHNPLPWPEPQEMPGPACYCGRLGCLETFLSGPGLVLDYNRAGGTARCVEELVAAAQRNEPRACSALERHAHRLARGLASVINLFDPQVIVIGGGLANLGGLFRRVPELWRAFIFSDVITTQLLPPRHGDSSGVRGAAWLWPQQG